MTETNEKGLETLLVWQKSLAFAVEICKTILPQLPAHEKWSLAAQLQRSSQSIPANIAEGYGRFYFQEGIRFCYIARGSLEETFSHVTLAQKLDYLDDKTYQRLNIQIKELRRMINGYIAFLKESKCGASEPGANHYLHEIPTIYLTEDDAPNY